MNKNQRKPTTIHKIIFTFSFFIGLFTIIIALTIFRTSWYMGQFEKHGVLEQYSEETAFYGIQNMLLFLKHQDTLDTLFFRDNEIAHLQDVQTLLDRLWILGACAIIYSIYLLTKTKRKIELLLIASGSISGGILLLGMVYLLVGFDWLFLAFHKLFFEGNYSFNPQFSNMKALLPDALFFELSLLLVTLLFLCNIILFVCCFIYTSKHKNTLI